MQEERSAENPHLDPVDQSLVEALQSDGRASFRQLAVALGVSEQTVARRYHRLYAENLLRVTVQPAPQSVGAVPLILRVRTDGGAGRRVAESVARRPDTPWVELLAGSSDVTFTTLTRSGGEDTAALLDALTRTPGVRESTPCMTLRNFTGPARWEEDLPRLDIFEQRLLAALQADSRATFDQLAQQLGAAPATVRRRLERLRSTQMLEFRTECDLELLGYPVETMTWLNVRPRDLSRIGKILAAHPAVRFAAAITGPANLVIATHHRTPGDLYRMQTDTLGTLNGIQHIDVTPTVRVVKRHGIPRNRHHLAPAGAGE